MAEIRNVEADSLAATIRMAMHSRDPERPWVDFDGLRDVLGQPSTRAGHGMHAYADGPSPKVSLRMCPASFVSRMDVCRHREVHAAIRGGAGGRLGAAAVPEGAEGQQLG